MSVVQKAVGLFFGSLNAASTLSVIIVVIYGATLTIKGSMSAGDLTSFILYSLTGDSLTLIACSVQFEFFFLFFISLVEKKSLKNPTPWKILLKLNIILLGMVYFIGIAVGSSVSGLSGLYTVAMKAAGASRRVFQLLDRVSSMPEAGDKCPLGSVFYI